MDIQDNKSGPPDQKEENKMTLDFCKCLLSDIKAQILVVFRIKNWKRTVIISEDSHYSSHKVLVKKYSWVY